MVSISTGNLNIDMFFERLMSTRLFCPILAIQNTVRHLCLLNGEEAIFPTSGRLKKYSHTSSLLAFPFRV